MEPVLITISIVAFLIGTLFFALILSKQGYLMRSMTPFQAALIDKTGSPDSWIIRDDESGSGTTGEKSIVDLVIEAEYDEADWVAKKALYNAYYYDSSGKLRLVENPTDAKSQKMKPWFLGFYKIGLPGVKRVTPFYTKWKSYTGDNALDKAILPKEGLIDTFKARPEFPFLMKETPMLDTQLADVLASAKYLIVDFTKARFGISSSGGQWQHATETDLIELGRAAVSKLTYQQLQKVGGESKEEFFDKKLSYINTQLFKKFGVILISIEILNAEFSDPVVAKNYRESVNAVAMAEENRKKAEKDLQTADLEGQAAYKKTKGAGDATNDLLQRKLQIERENEVQTTGAVGAKQNAVLKEKLRIEAANKLKVLTAQTKNAKTVKVTVASNLQQLRALSLDGKSSLLVDVLGEEKKDEVKKAS